MNFRSVIATLLACTLFAVSAPFSLSAMGTKDAAMDVARSSAFVIASVDFLLSAIIVSIAIVVMIAASPRSRSGILTGLRWFVAAVLMIVSAAFPRPSPLPD